MSVASIQELVTSTADAAFAIDEAGLVLAWNAAAAALFDTRAGHAMGKRCGEILQGEDESGPVCSPNCPMQQAMRKRQPIGNYDLRVRTSQGQVWCNVSALLVREAASSSPYAIYILSPIDTRKRLELLMRDFVAQETGLSPELASRVKSVTRAPARNFDLTKREREVLGLLADGSTSAIIAERLHISRTTVSNHTQHILRKLDAHTRLEAIVRAQRGGLI